MSPEWMGAFYGILLDSSLRSFLAASLVALVLVAVRVQSNGVRHAAWTAVLCAMLLMPVLPNVIPSIAVPVPVPAGAPSRAADWILTVPEPIRGARVVESGLPSPPAMAPALAAPAPEVPPARFSIWPIVGLVVYGAGTLILLSQLVIGWRGMRRIARSSQRIVIGARTDAELQFRGTPVCESKLVTVPLTIGVISPQITLPVTWRLWSDEKLSAVLAHELAHIWRRDPLIGLVGHVNRCIFWFHPLAWWLERKLASTAEHACDDAAVQAMGQARRYAEVLLDMAEAVRRQGGRIAWHGLGVDGNGLLAQRIDRILRGGLLREMSRARKAVVAIGCVSAITFVVACRRQVAPPPLQEDPEFAQELARGKAMTDQARAMRELSPQQVADLEAAVKKNPEDLEARRKLLAFYAPDVSGKKRPDEEQVIPARRRHILWLIEHHPELELTGSWDARIYPTSRDWLADPAGYEKGKKLWLAHAARPKVSPKILGHAAGFFGSADKPLAEQMLLRAQALDPTGQAAARLTTRPGTTETRRIPERWSIRLGRLYYEILVGSNAATLGGAIRSLSLTDAHSPYADAVRRRLAVSTDAELLATVAAALLRSPHDRESLYGPKTPRVDFATFALGKSYLERAAELDAQSAQVRYGLQMLQAIERQRHMWAKMGGNIPREARAQALAKLSEPERLSYLPGAAESAYMGAEYLAYTKDEAGARESYNLSRKYAEATLALAPKLRGESDYKSAVFRAKITLATLALREGDGKTAVRSMREATEVGTGSPYDPGQLWSRLATYLLKHGERESVIRFMEHLARVDPRQKDEHLRSAAAIRAGRMPRFYQGMMAAR